MDAFPIQRLLTRVQFEKLDSLIKEVFETQYQEKTQYHLQYELPKGVKVNVYKNSENTSVRIHVQNKSGIVQTGIANRVRDLIILVQDVFG